MLRLKIILQSKKFNLILIIISLLIIFVYLKLPHLSKYLGSEGTFEGTIVKYNIDGDKLSLTIKAKEKLQATYYITSEEEQKYLKDNIKYGSRLILEGELTPPLKNTIPNTFNYQEYLYHNHIYYLLKITSIKIDNNHLNIFYKIKNYIYEHNKKIINNNYLNAFILGDKKDIDSDIYNKYQRLGVTHLFAISGMHIGIIVLILEFIFKKQKELTKTIIILLLLGLYCFLIGMPSSLKRAFIFYVFYRINKIFDLNIKTIYLLNYTFFLNILFNPFIIFDLGFIFSITVSFGLILFKNKIKSKNYFVSLFKTSIISFLFSVPILISINYEINLMTPINNLVIIPLVSLIIFPLSIISFILPFMSNILTIFINLLDVITNLLTNINVLNIPIPKISFVFIIIYYTILLLIYKNKKYLILLIILFLFHNTKIHFDSSNYVYYMDVGQGDSALILNPKSNKVVMIDTGGKVTYNNKGDWANKKVYQLSSNIILLIKSLGFNKIDYLILSHGDYDHMGEAINLVNNFKVDKVVFNCGEYNDLESELIKVLDKKKIKYYSCINELNVNKNKLYFLQTKEYDNENDNSNVIYTELDGYKFMFMGDASSTTEKEILEKYNLSDVDVLKVGHHGSKTSSSIDFIDEINPKYSIISVGKNNRYGHPNKEVLENFKDSNIYRTDQDGSIMFKIKNNKLKIETCSP